MFFNIFSLFNLAKFITKSDYIFNNDNYIFNNVANVHLDLIGRLQMFEVPVDDNFAIKTSDIDDARLHNYYFRNSEFSKVRLSYLLTNEVQMFNSVWYPSCDYECPIFSVDLVHFGKNRSLCFINLINMFEDEDYFLKYETPFIKIKEKYPELSENTSIHLDTFNTILSKGMLYGHIYNSIDFQNKIPDVLEKYLNTYSNIFNKKKNINKFFIKDKHRFYNDLRYSVESTNYLTKKYFDNLWYSRLIDEYYF